MPSTQAFRRGGAEASVEFGEVVGGAQFPVVAPPFVAIDEVVPVGNDIAQGAAGMTEGHAAITCSGRPAAQTFDRQLLRQSRKS
jgi:hypothetical protein